MKLKILHYLSHLQALTDSECCTSGLNLQSEGGECETDAVM